MTEAQKALSKLFYLAGYISVSIKDETHKEIIENLNILRRALESHDALVEALELMADIWDASGMPPTLVRRKAGDALALAKGE